jgi:hypothetical protein
MWRITTFTLLLALTACGGASTDDAAEAPAADAAEQAAEAALQDMAARFADASAAVEAGFMRDPSGMCVTAAMVGLPEESGAMGVHYLHPGRLGLLPDAPRPDGTDGVIDWSQPEVLVYEPQADGTERLVAIEYLVFQEAWHAAGHEAAPAYFGTEFVAMADDPATEADEAHGFEAHYELHIWVPRDNSTGRYAEFNPAVSCANAPMQDMG